LLLIPFASYLLAELIHASGVLAVVVAGLIVAYTSARISTAASRRQTESVWPLGSYLLNGSLFVLIGLEVQAVADELGAGQSGRLLLIVVAVWAGLILVRFLFQSASVSLIRLLDRRPSQRARRMSYRARVVSSFAGFRGAISLAIALSVPATVESGEPFPPRDDIIFVTAGVIVLTLLVQGPLLPAVVGWARLPEDTATDQELRLAELAITTTAVTALPELAEEQGISEEVRERLIRDYDEHLRLVEANGHPPAPQSDAGVEGLESLLDDGASADISADAVLPARRVGVSEQSPLTRNEEYTRFRLALLDRKREVLLRLRHEGTIDDAVARRVQTRLDIEELRLTGVEPID
jgi:monovalent cation/hydrogen antiporter